MLASGCGQGKSAALHSRHKYGPSEWDKILKLNGSGKMS
jgi:hypothetical protein